MTSETTRRFRSTLQSGEDSCLSMRLNPIPALRWPIQKSHFWRASHAASGVAWPETPPLAANLKRSSGAAGMQNP